MSEKRKTRQKDARIRESKARRTWDLLKNTVGSLVGMGASQAIDTLSNLSPDQFNKLEKAVRLIGQVLSQGDIMSSYQKNGRVKKLIESEEEVGTIVKALAEISQYNLRVSPGEALAAHQLIMDDPNIAKQQPTIGHSDVFEFDDQESLVAAEELLGKHNIDVEEINGL